METRSVRKSLRSLWSAVDNAQTILGVSAMWQSIAWGLGVLVAALANVPWYWRVVLFLVVGTATLWAIIGVYAVFLQERIARVRSARRLLREVAAAVRRSRVQPDSKLDDVASYGWTLMRAGTFIDAAFDYRVVADYSAWLKVAEDKSKFHDEKFRIDEAMAEYFEKLADRLSVHDIDPRFHHPASFVAFRDAK